MRSISAPAVTVGPQGGSKKKRRPAARAGALRAAKGKEEVVGRSGRAARIRGGTLGEAEGPLLSGNPRVHRDPPVEVDPVSGTGAAVALAKRQLEDVGVLAG